MIRHGNPPYIECSSRGTKAFSAFYAKLPARGNKSIEEIYQAHKIFEDGTTGLLWRQAKGRKAVNQQECNALYSQIWDEYIKEHPEFIDVLANATGLQDTYGQPGHCCQATELWRIRNQIFDKGINS